MKLKIKRKNTHKHTNSHKWTVCICFSQPQRSMSSFQSLTLSAQRIGKNTPQSRDLHQGQINCYIHSEHFAMWISQSLQSNSIAERTVSKINNALRGAGINVIRLLDIPTDKKRKAILCANYHVHNTAIQYSHCDVIQWFWTTCFKT